MIFTTCIGARYPAYLGSQRQLCNTYLIMKKYPSIPTTCLRLGCRYYNCKEEGIPCCGWGKLVFGLGVVSVMIRKLWLEALPSKLYPCELHIKRANSQDILCALIPSAWPIWDNFLRWHNCWDVLPTDFTNAILKTQTVLYVLQYLQRNLDKWRGLIISFKNPLGYVERCNSDDSPIRLNVGIHLE